MAVIFTAFALAGCTAAFELFSRDVQVRILLPEASPSVLTMFPLSRETWILRWYDANGNEQSVHVEGSEADIVLEAGIFTPIIAIPVITTEGTPESAPEGATETVIFPQGFLPASGALFPLHAEGNPGSTTVRTDRIRALSALCAENVMLCASEGSGTGRRIAEAFNWIRFESLVSELECPGRLDRPRVVNALLAGSMRASSIREKPATVVTFVLPSRLPYTDGSILWPCDPGAEPLYVGISGAGIYTGSAVLCEGLHYWYNSLGILSVQVTGGTATATFFTSFPLR